MRRLDRFSWATIAFGGPEGYFNLAIIAFGAFGFIVPKYYNRLGTTDKRSLASLFKEVTVFNALEITAISDAISRLVPESLIDLLMGLFSSNR